MKALYTVWLKELTDLLRELPARDRPMIHAPEA